MGEKIFTLLLSADDKILQHRMVTNEYDTRKRLWLTYFIQLQHSLYRVPYMWVSPQHPLGVTRILNTEDWDTWCGRSSKSGKKKPEVNSEQGLKLPSQYNPLLWPRSSEVNNRASPFTTLCYFWGCVLHVENSWLVEFSFGIESLF